MHRRGFRLGLPSHIENQCQGQVHRRGFRLGLPSDIENQCQGQGYRRGFMFGLPFYTYSRVQGEQGQGQGKSSFTVAYDFLFTEKNSASVKFCVKVSGFDFLFCFSAAVR